MSRSRSKQSSAAPAASNEFSSDNNRSAGSDKTTGYKPEYARIAKVMCKNGATNADLAEAFGVRLNIISLWQSTHKDFLKACQAGMDAATDRVEASLYQRACGYTYTESKIIKHGGKIAIVEVRKHVSADVNAGTLWLCNRNPNRWKKDAKPIWDKAANDDPFLAFLRSLNGTSLRPVDDPPNDTAPAGANDAEGILPEEDGGASSEEEGAPPEEQA